MLLVNFVGAPGAGKSTMMAGIYFEMKISGWDVECIHEVSKERILENDQFSLSNEILMFAEKLRRALRLKKIDVALTDCSLRQSAYYAEGQFGALGETFFREVSEGFDNIYVIVERTHAYVPEGRMDETAAEVAGDTIVEDIKSSGKPYIVVPGKRIALEEILAFIEREASARGKDARFSKLSPEGES
jgi:hypothetical protein